MTADQDGPVERRALRLLCSVCLLIMAGALAVGIASGDGELVPVAALALLAVIGVLVIVNASAPRPSSTREDPTA